MGVFQSVKTQLEVAVKKGNIVTVNDLLMKHRETGDDFIQSDLSDALIMASKDGRSIIVDLLLAYGAKTDGPKATDDNGLTPLMWASNNGHIDIVENLILHGAKTEVKSHDGRTAFTIAEYQYQGTIMKLLNAKRS